MLIRRAIAGFSRSFMWCWTNNSYRLLAAAMFREQVQHFFYFVSFSPNSNTETCFPHITEETEAGLKLNDLLGVRHQVHRTAILETQVFSSKPVPWRPLQNSDHNCGLWAFLPGLNPPLCNPEQFVEPLYASGSSSENGVLNPVNRWAKDLNRWQMSI